MLLDVVRAGWQPDGDVRRLLGRSFYDHHSRLMYAFIYDFPAHLTHKEIEDLVDEERDAYHVDGPEGYDWVFRNMHLAKHEGLMNVDYCLNAEGGGEWSDPLGWGSPKISEQDKLRATGVIELVESLSRLGVLTFDGLQAIGKAWRDSPSEPSWHEVRERNRAVLAALDVSNARSAEDLRRAVDYWHMPILRLDLSEDKKVTMAEAKKRQIGLQEDFMAREYGQQ